MRLKTFFGVITTTIQLIVNSNVFLKLIKNVHLLNLSSSPSTKYSPIPSAKTAIIFKTSSWET